MKKQRHERQAPSGDKVQTKNQEWWSENPMQYDWNEDINADFGSSEFFDVIDQRFLESSPFYDGDRPFAELIPFDYVAGSDVLEIGCGLGTHAEILAEAEANLTAIDLTEHAVRLTRRRLDLANLPGEVHQMDGESLAFDDDSFDFIWSWGVIHHSRSPEKILQEARRVLRPGGELRMMVYNRKSISAAVACILGLGDLLKGASMDDVLGDFTDGHLARWYTRDSLAKLLKDAGFSETKFRVLGQTTELIPLPGSSLKDAIVEGIPKPVARTVLRRVGGFLYAVAHPNHAHLS